MPEFSIGDRVVSVVDNPDNNHRIHIGSTGAVCRTGTGRVAVEWDDYVGGHDCEGHCAYGHGWWVDICGIELDNGSDESDESFDFDEDEFKKLVFGRA